MSLTEERGISAQVARPESGIVAPDIPPASARICRRGVL
jgi:hypothetical protein